VCGTRVIFYARINQLYHTGHRGIFLWSFGISDAIPEETVLASLLSGVVGPASASSVLIVSISACRRRQLGYWLDAATDERRSNATPLAADPAACGGGVFHQPVRALAVCIARSSGGSVFCRTIGRSIASVPFILARNLLGVLFVPYASGSATDRLRSGPYMPVSSTPRRHRRVVLPLRSWSSSWSPCA